MRKSYLFIIAVTLITVACKKQPTELNSTIAPVPEAQENNFSNPCFGNTWNDVGAFNPGVYLLQLTYNNKLYVFKYYTQGDNKFIHIYDGNSWEVIYSDIPFWTNHPRAFAFIIGNKGYIGKTSSSLFYEYDFATNTFTPKAAYPGIGEYGVATFSVGNRGYIMGGTYTMNGNTYNSNDTWQYNPTMNSWSQKADFAWLGMSDCTGFSIGNKGYLVNGKITFPNSTVYSNSLFEYNPANDSWNNKAAFPSDPRITTNAFVIGNYAYVGGGYSIVSPSGTYGTQTDYPDFHKYNPANDQWTQIADISVQGKSRYCSFVINSKGYVVCDADYGGTNMVKYTPRTCPPVSNGRTSAN